jgi:hypothetical protein
MEFFSTTIVPASTADLHRRLIISELLHWCASIEKVLRDAESSGEIYCVRGTFLTHRENLHHGVRFSLPECPNGLAMDCDHRTASRPAAYRYSSHHQPCRT